MDIRIGIVATIEASDKLKRILAIEGIRVAEYVPVWDIVDRGITTRCTTFEEVVAVLEASAKPDKSSVSEG